MSSIFLPKDVSPGKYTGGLEQPIDWKVNRRLYAGKINNTIVIVVTAQQLAPQDRDALVMFETRYSTGDSSLVYDGISLRLEIQDTNLPMDSLTDQDFYSLLVECYKAVELQKTDYTDKMTKKYFGNTFTVEKRVGDVKRIETAIFNPGTEYERAPDVYVRPTAP